MLFIAPALVTSLDRKKWAIIFGVYILAKQKELWDVLLDQMHTRSRTNVCVTVAVREFLPLEVVQESFRGHFFLFFCTPKCDATSLTHAPIDTLEFSGVPRSARSCLAAVLV